MIKNMGETSECAWLVNALNAAKERLSESCLARLTAAVQKRSPRSSPWQGSETGLEKVEEIEARIKWICWEVLHSIYYGVRYIGSFTVSLKVRLVRVNCLRVFLDELSRRGQYSMYIYCHSGTDWSVTGCGVVFSKFQGLSHAGGTGPRTLSKQVVFIKRGA